MIGQKENNEICNIMYSIRNCINDDDSIGALSLANDLYFILLRATIDDKKIKCDSICKEREE